MLWYKNAARLTLHKKQLEGFQAREQNSGMERSSMPLPM